MTKVLHQILADLAAITDVELNRARSLFSQIQVEAGEEVLAVIEDIATHRLWALSLEYKRRAQLAHHASQFDARDKEDREKLEADARRWRSMADVCRDMAWQEMRDVAGVRAWNADAVGLRAGFTLVSTTTPAEDVGTFGIPIPRAVMESFRKMMAGADREEAPEPKKKPS